LLNKFVGRDDIPLGITFQLFPEFCTSGGI
jgi:hypothetical protein